jgi:hypothetical protein
MAKGFGLIYKPCDLPMTMTVCTNCGQWLDFEETIEGAMLPDCEPKDLEAWAAWVGGDASPDEIEWVFYCPTCHVKLSDKPPRDVIIIYADAFSEVGELVERKRCFQALIHQHQKNLHYREMQIAKYGELDASLYLLNSREDEKKKLRHFEQELHTVEQRLRNKLASL